MMISEAIVTALIERKIEGTDLFIVSAKVLPGNRIRVFIDSLSGVNVKDCVGVSRQIESNLDREVEDYELEVSSPGLTEPFTHPLQFKKNLGREVRVVLIDGTAVKGELTEFDGERITLKPELKKNKVEQEPIVVPLIEIKEAKTVISFK